MKRERLRHRPVALSHIQRSCSTVPALRLLAPLRTHTTRLRESYSRNLTPSKQRSDKHTTGSTSNIAASLRSEYLDYCSWKIHMMRIRYQHKRPRWHILLRIQWETCSAAKTLPTHTCSPGARYPELF